ncbi:hypothetical protein AB0E69_25700 [Kribbella sp. NPDC026611]|uniref:alpha/beta hydrolase family protein n=1 Tax=Kribbella sp. NPDC026611 TaxID=3154911 RepID=UPI0033FF85F1
MLRTAVAAIGAAFTMVAPAAVPAEADAGGCGARGRVVSVSQVLRLTRSEVDEELQGAGLPVGAQYGVDSYRVVYCTISAYGEPAIASGLLALPHGKRGRLPVVSYEHSTVAKRADAPSALVTDESRLVSSFFASGGFAVSAPDYLGLGVSAGLHPYVHAASEASASVDMLTAADRVASLSHRVFLTGFSQGGHAVMATGQALQRSGSRWAVAALAPISGPYDLATEFPVMFDPNQVDPQRASGYISYVLTAWNPLYHLYDDPAEAFTEPSAGRLADLYDGTHEIDEIAAALPPPTQLVQPSWRALLEHPTGRLAAAIRANQVCRWAPDAPTRLYASHGDRDVVFANAESCLHQLHQHGAHAQLIDLGQLDHVASALASLPAVRSWFTQEAHANGPQN